MASLDLDFHSFCVANTGTRLDQYAHAIGSCVRPGDVVLDLGSGTGLLAFMACRAGARRVYAIEATDAIALGMQLASSSGFADRVEFINQPSSRVTLPEHVDVIVADIHDTFGLQAHGLTSFFDARDRFLKPGGTLIPRAVELYVAPVEAPHQYEKLVGGWTSNVQGIDLSPIRVLAVNREHAGRFEPQQLLSEPAALATIPLASASAPHAGGSVRVTAARGGAVHGVCGSFISTLADGVTIGNLPGNTGTSNFAQAFFPIERPVAVSAGDTISIAIDRIDGTETRWQVEIGCRGASAHERFVHSTFDALPLSVEALRKQADSYRPLLSKWGSMERALLDRFDGASPASDLASWLMREFGELLPSDREAAAFLKSTIERCG